MRNPNKGPVLPITTILASIPCSYLDLEYGSIRGYSTMQNDVEGGGGECHGGQGKGKKGERRKDQEIRRQWK